MQQKQTNKQTNKKQGVKMPFIGFIGFYKKRFKKI